ncbi:MAG TPA: ribonuclease H [Solirubrobacteraceae bacterium]|nr:ribonuclease H [Solirubrobacteraceae bacterium]
MAHIDERDINIFTDGSMLVEPRRGGIGIRFITVDAAGAEHCEDYPLAGYDGATNQQMELKACIEALRAVVTRRAPIHARSYRQISIFTDSMYLCNGYDSARFQWHRNGWQTREGNPVANAPLWKELLKLARRTGLRVEFKWVKGHRDSAHNKAVDKLAKESAGQRTGERLAIVKVRRKHSGRQVEPGSVAMQGQRLSIRIITDQFEQVQRMNRYKYEVLSRASPYRGCVDWIFSAEKIHLSAGHAYQVRVNDETARPRVVKVFRELVEVPQAARRSAGA